MKTIYLVMLLPLLMLVFVIWLVKYVWSLIFAPRHAMELAQSIDQLANTALNGDMDETISSRAGRAIRDDDKRNTWWACPLCWLLNKLDPDHCNKSIGY